MQPNLDWQVKLRYIIIIKALNKYILVLDKDWR